MWTAVLPYRGGAERKTRLSDRFDRDARQALSDRMLRHAAEVLGDVPTIDRLLLLSDAPPADWRGGFIRDGRRGLNVELQAFAATVGSDGLLVVLPDLPLVAREDIEALLGAAAGGCAIAPDRHGTGTNAIALLYPQSFAFAFGPGSFSRHIATAGPDAAIVRRTGLGLDCDMADDLEAAIALGFRPGDDR